MNREANGVSTGTRPMRKHAGRRGAPPSVTAPDGAIARCAGSNASAAADDDPFGKGRTPQTPPSLTLRHTYAVAAMMLIVRQLGGGTGVEKGPPYPYLFICWSIVWLPRAASVWCLRVVAVLLPPSRRLTAPSPAARAPTLLRLPVMILLGRGGPLKPSALGT